ncbi:UNVERIFIED_CONTAM: hypothetical protein GTU68_054489 [Idotea baltica]|nr:hypothetical protein [Idotea baltica]
MITRFAPSPTGLLHPGHAFSALSAWQRFRGSADAEKRFLLRIEDIDFNRCRADYERMVIEDLQWLGLEWESPIRRQSEHLADFQQVADDLKGRGFLYPCFCTRKDILREIERAGGAPHGSEGPVYPGTCRELSADEASARIEAGETFALRIDLEKSLGEIGTEITWQDEAAGDAVLVRKDIGTSYHLAVVCDDAWQGVTHITRGLDLFESTHLHRVLQELLGFPEPLYFHHELIRDDSGKRLAKRDESETLRSWREAGVSVDEVKKRLGFEGL